MRGEGGRGHSFSGKRCLMFQPALKRQTSTVKTVEVKRLASTPDSITVAVYGWCINLCALASTVATRWRSAVSGTCPWVGKGGIIIPHTGICPDSLESRSAHSFVVKRSLREQFFVLGGEGGKCGYRAVTIHRPRATLAASRALPPNSRKKPISSRFWRSVTT